MHEAKENGFYDIMLETWFCYNPINGKPCGICNPCKYTIEEGMGFRVGVKGLINNKLIKMKQFCANLLRKIGIYDLVKKVVKRQK